MKNKVSILGGGPAGMAIAHYSKKAGYNFELFEAFLRVLELLTRSHYIMPTFDRARTQSHSHSITLALNHDHTQSRSNAITVTLKHARTQRRNWKKWI